MNMDMIVDNGRFAMAKAELGAKYDDRGFHDTILVSGSLPLAMLEQRIAEWVARTKG